MEGHGSVMCAIRAPDFFPDVVTFSHLRVLWLHVPSVMAGGFLIIRASSWTGAPLKPAGVGMLMNPITIFAFPVAWEECACWPIS
jgi:hypothetical protein